MTRPVCWVVVSPLVSVLSPRLPVLVSRRLFLQITQSANYLIRPVSENSNVAVFGIGCVGLSILQGAKAKKCAKVIAIDVNNGKKETALQFGASESLKNEIYFLLAESERISAEFINPKELLEGQSIVDKLIEMTDGGCDFTYDATGNVQVMRQALEACHKGWGVSTIIGVAPAGAEISTRPYVDLQAHSRSGLTCFVSTLDSSS